jgi:glycine/D-amino acid oxidase-like deaminating enzyme
MKIAIVGAGMTGLATAWGLAGRGHEVDLFEQGLLPNPKASSHDSHRLIRYPYGAEAGYARMVVDAYAAWERLWADLGARHYVETGTLCLGEAPWTEHAARVMAAMGRPMDRLGGAEIARRFPIFPKTIGGGLWVPSGGVLLADRILDDLTRYLAGAVGLHPETPVRAVDPERGRLTLGDGTMVGADLVIVAAGPWIGRLVPRLLDRAVPSRQVAVYLEPPAALADFWKSAPLVIDIDATRGFYAVPPVAGTTLKLGDHTFSRTGDPDDDRVSTEAEIIATLDACRTRLVDFDRYRVLRGKVCYYTVEAQEKFIMERIGPAALALSPCSGHGFKFGPLIGSRVAEAVETGAFAALATWARGEAA